MRLKFITVPDTLDGTGEKISALPIYDYVQISPLKSHSDSALGVGGQDQAAQFLLDPTNEGAHLQLQWGGRDHGSETLDNVIQQQIPGSQARCIYVQAVARI